jgi:hypothetical protein
MDAFSPGDIRARSDHAALLRTPADGEGSPGKARVVQLLYRAKEGIQVEVDDRAQRRVWI